MDTPLSVNNMFSNTITDPTKVFDSIKLKNSFMAPLLINLLLASFTFYLYYDQLDAAWFIDYIISVTPEELAPDQIEAMRKNVNPDMMKYFVPVVVAVIVVVLILLQALVLHIIGNVRNNDVSYGEWFALICWSSVPAILLGIMVILNLSIGDNSQLRPEFLNPISIATLFDLEMPGNFNKFMSMLSIITFWSIYLVASGVQRWSNSSTIASYLVALSSFALLWLIQIFVF